MSEIENAAIEAASEQIAIPLSPRAAAVIFPLAIYGGADLTRRAVQSLKEKRAARKAKKAAPSPEHPSIQQ